MYGRCCCCCLFDFIFICGCGCYSVQSMAKRLAATFLHTHTHTHTLGGVCVCVCVFALHAIEFSCFRWPNAVYPIIRISKKLHFCMPPTVLVSFIQTRELPPPKFAARCVHNFVPMSEGVGGGLPCAVCSGLSLWHALCIIHSSNSRANFIENLFL